MIVKCKRYEREGPDGLENPDYTMIKMVFHMGDVANCEENVDKDKPGTDVQFYNGTWRSINIDFYIFSKWYEEFHSKPRFSVMMN